MSNPSAPFNEILCRIHRPIRTASPPLLSLSPIAILERKKREKERYISKPIGGRPTATRTVFKHRLSSARQMETMDKRRTEREKKTFTHRSEARDERNARGRSSRRRLRRLLPRPRLHPDALRPKRRDGARSECRRSHPNRKIRRCKPASASPALGCSPARRDYYDDDDDGDGVASPPRRPNCSRPPPRCPRVPNTWTCPRASCFSAIEGQTPDDCCA